MTQNFSKKDNEHQNDTQVITLKSFYDYSASAESHDMFINDLVEYDSEKNEEQKDVNNLVPFVMISTNVANQIEDEIAKFWTSKNVICRLIRELNRRNVFNFVKNMLTISDSRSVLGDIKKYITYYELKHIIYCMLTAAEAMELKESSKYKMLHKEYDIVDSICSKNSSRKVDKKTIAIVDLRLENLFEEMSKHQN